MTNESTNLSHRDSAMKDGTILGCMWILTFTFSTIMMRHIISTPALGTFSMFAVAGLTFASPILVYTSAKKHWSLAPKEEISFSGIWLYIAIMYMCAILLSAVAQFIYYEYCDPYLFYDFMTDFSSIRIEGDTNGEMSKAVIEQFKIMNDMSASDIVFSEVGGHTTRDILMTTVMAFIISRNLKNRI